MKREPCYCASCKEFKLNSSGRAPCQWFGERDWNHPACVLHTPATDRDARKRIVIQLMKAEKE